MRRITVGVVSLIFLAAAYAGPENIQVTTAAARPSANGAAQNFSGATVIDPLFSQAPGTRLTVGRVTFELGAHTAWHTHPAGQILIVTSGRGWIQEWGGQKREIKTGDVVWIPPGIKHWHGATATSGMTHIAIQEVIDGRNVDWLEKVSDEQYGGAR